MLLDVAPFSGCDWVISCDSVVGERMTSGVGSDKEADIKRVGFSYIWVVQYLASIFMAKRFCSIILNA